MGRVNEQQAKGSDVKRFGVVGHPISHSKSPQIHQLFASQLDEQIEYEKYDVKPEVFDTFVQNFFQEGGEGLNITVPFKELAYNISIPATDKVRMAKAVNTLYCNEAGQLVGENTDGAGLVRDLTINQGIKIQDRRVLILGAGGAVRGIIPSILDQNPGSITIANRTIGKAVDIKKEYKNISELKVSSFEDITTGPFDLIINGTSLGLENQSPAISPGTVNSDTSCYDLMYSSDDTAFVSWCNQNGAGKAVDGLGMLVEQAAVSFNIWLGRQPATESVINALR